MTDAETLKLIREAMEFAVPELADVHLTSETSLSDLGISSVTALEMIGFIEEKLNIRFPDDELAGLNTVAALDRLIRSHWPAIQTEEG